jgi:hypothetical protein
MYSRPFVSPESEATSRRSRSTSGGWLLRRLAQYGVVAVALAAPLLIGGAYPTIQVVLSLGALLAAAAWLASRRMERRLPPFSVVLLLAAAGTAIQLVPLPSGLVDALSPRALELRTEVLGHHPAFAPLTLDVPATVLALLRLLACLGIVVVTASASRWRGRTIQFAVPLAIVGGAIGLLSFAQRFLGMDGILGLYTVKEMPGSGFFGTFVNGNHAASLFALSALMAIGCARESDGPLKLACWISAAVSVLAVLSTGSRMGLVGLAVGLCTMAACWLIARFGPRRGLLVAAAVAAVAGPATALFAFSMRRPSGVPAAAILDEQKIRGWRAGLAMTREYLWTGVGRGAFEGPAAAFRSEHQGVRLVFPESLPVQMLSEWGLPLTLALCAAFAVPGVRIARRLPRWEPVYQGAACGLLAVLVHELADFGLELPGVAFPAAMALGLCSARLAMSTTEAGERRLPLRGVAAAGVLAAWAVIIAVGIWAVPRTSDADGVIARGLSNDTRPAAVEQMQGMVRRHPAEYHFELLAARQGLLAHSKDTIRHINRALRLHPSAAMPHVLAFHHLARIGLRTQAAMEYRLAVERGYPFSFQEVVGLVGPVNALRAVPQRPGHLLFLAASLLAGGRRVEAEVATQRAVDVSGGDEEVRCRRMEIALDSRHPPFIRKAADELARAAVSSRGFALAVRGLATSGELDRARALAREALAAVPEDASLTVQLARTLFTHGDLDGARSLLASRSSQDLPLGDRIAGERLVAEIADKQGQTDAAAAARTRARLLERLQGGPQPP